MAGSTSPLRVTCLPLCARFPLVSCPRADCGQLSGGGRLPTVSSVPTLNANRPLPCAAELHVSCVYRRRRWLGGVGNGRRRRGVAKRTGRGGAWGLFESRRSSPPLASTPPSSLPSASAASPRSARRQSPSTAVAAAAPSRRSRRCSRPKTTAASPSARRRTPISPRRRRRRRQRSTATLRACRRRTRTRARGCGTGGWAGSRRRARCPSGGWMSFWRCGGPTRSSSERREQRGGGSGGGGAAAGAGCACGEWCPEFLVAWRGWHVRQPPGFGRLPWLLRTQSCWLYRAVQGACSRPRRIVECFFLFLLVPLFLW